VAEKGAVEVPFKPKISTFFKLSAARTEKGCGTRDPGIALHGILHYLYFSVIAHINQERQELSHPERA
jgi:hypothetical protein